MSTRRTRRTRLISLAALAAAGSMMLAGCAAADPFEPGDETGAPERGTIVVGSQAYYSNEIIAEIYAQALEAEGYTVERRFSIGQRDAYIPALEAGEVDLFPEYTGNLLQFYAPDTTATEADAVYQGLRGSLPEELTVLAMSSATDQDSYNVTEAFAAEHGVSSLADLAALGIPLTLGGAPELAERPYGPNGLLEVYGVEVGFAATGDTTVEDLLAGTIQLANVYSADPRIQTEGLVTLADPQGLFLASNVVPLVNAELAAELAPIIDPISAALTPEGLVAMNVASTTDQRSSADIAREWIAANLAG